jgi:trimethylamine--corrinoid protein Co-methyltransferase
MRRNRTKRAATTANNEQITPPQGGRFAPLTQAKVSHIVDSAFAILQRIGIAQVPADLRQIALHKGGQLRADGRLTFSRSLVEDIIAGANKNVELPGFDPHKGIVVGGGRVHIGTGGAAVQMLDAGTNIYRDSQLQDLYDLMRIVDTCDSIHYSLRPVVARDISDPRDLDINTAFAAMKATSKPIGTSFFEPTNVAPVVSMFDAALGGAESAFRKQPFCFASICHVVPPLTMAEEACGVMQECVRLGMPLQLCSAAQAGATSPASLAGALAQGLAESLAGLVLVNMLQPGFPCILAFMPFISDLRTGSMSGGSGEAAVASAAAAQLLLSLGLPSTVSAGMTDAKVLDAQAGYEKGYTIALAAQAGADMINLSVGMLGSIMVASKESLVIDNDMCGAILRSVQGINLFDGAIDLDVIESVVTGEGHFLGTTQTLDLMTTEYRYPSLADRQSVSDWLSAGANSITDRAVQRVAQLESLPHPEHLSKQLEAKLRASFSIQLAEQG